MPELYGTFLNMLPIPALSYRLLIVVVSLTCSALCVFWEKYMIDRVRLFCLFTTWFID